MFAILGGLRRLAVRKSRSGSRKVARYRAPDVAKPAVEPLEDRFLLAILPVTSSFEVISEGEVAASACFFCGEARDHDRQTDVDSQGAMTGPLSASSRIDISATAPGDPGRASISASASASANASWGTPMTGSVSFDTSWSIESFASPGAFATVTTPLGLTEVFS